MPDLGHEALMNDIWHLMEEAKDFEFHDFQNQKYATPKVSLYQKLMKMAEDVKNGKYDNEP